MKHHAIRIVSITDTRTPYQKWKHDTVAGRVLTRRSTWWIVAYGALLGALLGSILGAGSS